MSSFTRRPTHGSTNSSTSGSLLRRPGSAMGMPRPANLVHTSAVPSGSSSNGGLNASTTSSLNSPTTAHLTKALKPPVGAEVENNINVVVRVRGRSSAEVAAREPLVAEVDGLRSPNVTLVNPNASTSSSSSAAASASTLPSTKTYDFGFRPAHGKAEPVGNVFGPDADQVMLYNDVAKPILDQVLQGYNCTMFAYGQTGTGKTYTMEGDLSVTNGYSISPQAGIIPRTLYSLFAKLSEDQAEFAVKCSFLELYNEELRDLNALDYTDPETTTPSTTTAKTAPAPAGLKIQEDGKTGVVVQGLEETMIKTAEEGIKVLKRGSDRRQVAATKCNDRSSRSHSIFTITIHVKENSTRTGGEDLLKVGKLNLVDLAGSENVGRSGATNGRAREAGNINASLLALGRVINKLVEKAPGAKSGEKTHIPYRDSKLTRLLQDSLGGRTKTTIIAAISPVNFDETISTLDYASKAKSIQNRPEVNQRMSRNLLLGQYASEIERLKQDLVATRQKNGIYFSAESWEILSAEQEAARVGLSESRRALELCEARVDAVKDQYEMSLRLVGMREKELKQAAVLLDEVRDEVTSLMGRLEERTRELDEATLLGDARECSRQGWRDTARVAVSHVSLLYDKVDRKTKVEQDNLVIVSTGEKALTTRTKSLAKSLASFAHTHDSTVLRGKKRLADTIERGQQATASTIAYVEQQSVAMNERAQSALDLMGRLETRGEYFASAVEISREELAAALVQASEALVATNREATELQRRVAMLRAEELANPVRALQADLVPTLKKDANALRSAQEVDQAYFKSVSNRSAHLRQTEAACAVEERESFARETSEIVDDLTQQLSGVLSSAYVERFITPLQDRLSAWSDRHFLTREAQSSRLKKGLEALDLDTAKAMEERAGILDGLVESNGLVPKQVEQCARAAEVAAQKRQKELVQLSGSVEQALKSCLAGVHAQGEEQIGTLRLTNERLATASTEHQSGSADCQAKLDKEITALVEEAGDSLIKVAQAHEVTRDMYTEELMTAREDLKALSSSATELVSSSSSSITQMQKDVKTYLASSYNHDVSTGATPLRRQWAQEAVPQLDGTPSRVIDRLRRAQEEGSLTIRPTPASPVRHHEVECGEEVEREDMIVEDNYRAPTPPSVEETSAVLEVPPLSPISVIPRKRNTLLDAKIHMPLQVLESTNLNMRTSRSRRRG
ncbi:BZ3500_MvSof-1268-A1-R1_Chr2-2g04999 [Microbotryum saponariae]|uniref:BZ3500_MvSof-1268-A1-R1_Chr2-2g04999 protein n=1 Tax=Microbotryum saponariae TaxID=289078 RepID=A0A2X0KWV5_9BASI|nr:BZ3500_MvSof-1268-A1-R1_Chr2-2g04999 [Microbotryum saponariae]SDA00673.1 BZ3501_MvSof-1269-A2-R1_Chr2-2g04673 [Microbotryum saponariae]